MKMARQIGRKKAYSFDFKNSELRTTAFEHGKWEKGGRSSVQ
jgi:hypothetical protein